MSLAAMFFAIGLDPDVATIFVQSHVPEHSQLGWIMECTVSYGELSRMTQFKDKAAKRQQDFVSAGLFTYPALQAADILLYDANEVPVGDDQRQHVELMREVARRFNERFGPTLVEPEHRIPAVGARIMDLQDPTAKMSTTSGSEAGTVYVLDEPDGVRKKFRSAVTDSGREVRRAGPEGGKEGIENLIEILCVVRDTEPDAVETEFEGRGYGDFKTAVGDAVADFLAPVRERYAELRGDPAELERVLASGAEKARALCEPVLADVRDAMGVAEPR
jgi:tryptophanyl-tRNA synthetase